MIDNFFLLEKLLEMLGFLTFIYWAYYTTARSRLRGEKNLVRCAPGRAANGGRAPGWGL